MPRYILAGLSSGVLFVLMDALIHANPLARRLHEAYAPIARKSFNPASGIAIDLVYGFIIAGLYLLLRSALPGSTPFTRAPSFALILWFLRVLMGALSQWVMFEVPGSALLYDVAAGGVEMLLVSLACAMLLGLG